VDLNINTRRLLPPTNITISYPKESGSLLVTWNMVRNPDVDKEDGDIKKIMYNVYRGISANGIFYKQNQAPVETNRYQDRHIGKNPNTVYWYKVSTLYQDKDGKIVEGDLSGPFMYRVSNTNKWFHKANERNLWILKNTGQLFDLYTRKYEGTRCKCWSESHGQAGNPDCTICYGTGFVGGFEPMFQLYVRLKPAETSLDITPQEFTYNNLPGAWTISTVQIKNRDLLIGPDGIIYSVLSSYVNQAAGYLFHQELKLKELDPNDPLYKMQRSSLYPNL
jgi:hypothetical protein